MHSEVRFELWMEPEVKDYRRSGEAQGMKGMTEHQPRLAEALGYTETVASPQNNKQPKRTQIEKQQ